MSFWKERKITRSTFGDKRSNSVCLVLVTSPRGRAAERLARGLIQENLAACVNRLPVDSTYRWQGKIETAKESLLLIKTTFGRFPHLQRYVRSHHPYTVPEIIALPVTRGWARYLEWVCASVSSVKG